MTDDTDSLTGPDSPAGPGPGSDRLHDLFVGAAGAITPSPVPLTRIMARVRARRLRRAGLTAACGLVLVAAVAGVLRTALPYGDRTVHPAATHRPVPTPSPSGGVGVVAPGERVRAAPGVQLWLTRDGMHLRRPDGTEAFDPAPGSGHHETAGTEGTTVGRDSSLAGLYSYQGKGEVAAVRIVTPAGTVEGRTVHLAGQRWGAWYVLGHTRDTARLMEFQSFTLYDTAGHVLRRTPSAPGGKTP
jgi:hypothetical protein